MLKGVVEHGYVLCAGIGFEVHAAVPLADGEAVTLFIRTLARENQADTLYGFACEADKQMFDSLRAVDGVGPTVALEAVRQLGASGVARAVARGDTKTLTGVKGIGPKSAGRIIASGIHAPYDDGAKEHAVDSLVALGVDRERAKAAVVAAVEQVGDSDENALIGEALARAVEGRP